MTAEVTIAMMKNNHYRVHCDGLDVIVNALDKYINATMLCREIGKTNYFRSFERWRALIRSKRIVMHSEKQYRKRTIYAKSKDHYVHRSMVENIAAWADPKSLVKVHAITHSRKFRKLKKKKPEHKSRKYIDESDRD